VSENDVQLLLPLGPVRNSELFSNYWLNNRLPLEPDWHELQKDAEAALVKLRALWDTERSRVEKYGTEAPLEEKFIQPILETLGWKLFYQTLVQGRKPDYALFLTDDAFGRALDHGRSSPKFWDNAAVVADAKAWHVSLDKPQKVDGRKEYPPEQMEWYLERTQRQWGILTNGRLWRLIPRVIPPGKPRFQTYLEVDLPSVLEAIGPRDQADLEGHHVREFLYFYLLFSPTAFVSCLQRAPLIERAMLGSSEYAVGVSEDLKERVFDALSLCISGFLKRTENKLSFDDLETCKTNSFVLLYRLLFVMYAEDRGLLPYRINGTYTQNRSLARLRDEIAHQLDRRGELVFREDRTELWKDLTALFDLVDAGHARYGVPAYNGGLFSSEQHPFLTEKAIADRQLAQVIDKVSRTIDPQNRQAGLFRVDYRDLAIRQLGSVYEGLLEMQPRYASQPLAIIKSVPRAGTFTEKFHPLSTEIPKGFRDTGRRVPVGTIYLETDKGERRATGSYYTPDHIVDHIVQNTLGPLCARIQKQITTEIQAIKTEVAKTGNNTRKHELTRKLDEIQGAFGDRVLALKILDPAMGSGHFLVRACQYLAEEIATNPFTSDQETDQLDEENATLTFWKRRVAEHALFGVDVNPLAVELAKLALWLETVSKERPLAFLDHHLRWGNSLVGARLTDLTHLPGAPELFAASFQKEFSEKKAEMLDPLHQLELLQSNDATTVKAKERLLKQYENRASGFTALGDIWCAEFFKSDGQVPITPEEYGDLIGNLGRPKLLKPLLERYGEVGVAIRRSVTPFHWELEFPEVFLDPPRDAEGFDAVIGNPPYDVLASKELETDLSPLKRFLEAKPEYEPSFVGKNNLYKLFVCRAIDLLRQEGLLGFIVPMPLLGDEYAIGVRKLILAAGTFREVHAFPQKDDPKNRVFPEAKLSTAVFVMVKSSDASIRAERFTSTRHPGRYFLEHSPSLTIAAEEIPKYDPSNMTVVSCAQEDWDLAVRLMKQEHFCRLGELCTSFQGELNETTDKTKGFSFNKSEGWPRDSERFQHLSLCGAGGFSR